MSFAAMSKMQAAKAVVVAAVSVGTLVLGGCTRGPRQPVQQVVPVDHTHTAEDLVQSGRDVEQMVLARALRLVFEDRVFLCGNRTVIFD